MGLRKTLRAKAEARTGRELSLSDVLAVATLINVNSMGEMEDGSVVPDERLRTTALLSIAGSLASIAESLGKMGHPVIVDADPLR